MRRGSVFRVISAAIIILLMLTDSSESSIKKPGKTKNKKPLPWKTKKSGIFRDVSTSSDETSKDSEEDFAESAESKVSIQGKDDCSSAPKDPKLIDNIPNAPLLSLLERTELELPSYFGHAVLLFGNKGSEKKAVAGIIAASKNLNGLTVYNKGKDGKKKLKIYVTDADDDGIKSTSQTLGPRLINPKDKEKGVSFALFDTIDFKDKASHIKGDITEKYLLHVATSRLESFSILLVASEKSLEDKTKFGSVLKRVAELTSDIEAIEGGVGLVVTGVKNSGTDDEKLASIKTKLNKLLEELKSSDDDQNRMAKKQIKLLQMTLPDGKIAILRDPDTCGKFKKSSNAKINKAAITELAKSGLEKISNKPKTQFKISLVGVEGASDAIEEVDEIVSKSIPSVVSSFVEKIKEEQNRILSSVIGEFTAIKKWIIADFEAFSKVPNLYGDDESSSPQAAKDLQILLFSALVNRTYDVNLGRQFQIKMQRIQSQLEFFDEALGGESNTIEHNIKSWIAPFNSWVENDLRSKVKVFDFLEKLKGIVWGNTFQGERRKPNTQIPSNAAGLKSLLGEQDGKIVPDSLDQHLSQDSLASNIMKEILTEALKDPTVECFSDNELMKITGSIIICPPPSVPDKYINSREPKLLCPGSDSFPNRVIIHATRSIMWKFTPGVAASSTSATKELGVVAPTLYFIHGNGVISFKGEAGRSGYDKSRYGRNLRRKTSKTAKHNSTKPRRFKRERNDRNCKQKDGANGRDGLPGDHGYPGGNFIGMFLLEDQSAVQEIVVDVGGGNGADGQDGGDGENGSGGQSTPNYTPDQNPHFNACNRGQECSGSYPLFFDKCEKDTYTDDIFCHHFACPSGSGGNGGNGGAGGQSGKAGHALVISNKHASVRKSEGRTGSNGGGGFGGQALLRSEYVKWAWKAAIKGPFGLILRQPWWEFLQRQKYHNYEGSRGQAGSNTQGQEGFPSNPQFALTPYDVYEGYVETILTRPPTRFPHEAENLLTFIETQASEIFPNDIPKIFQFGEQVLALERVQLRLRMEKIGKTSRIEISQRLLPRYENLKGGMDSYIAGISRSLSDEEKKLMSMIYAMAIHQITVQRQARGVPVVTDMDKYLELLNTRLDNYEIMEQEDEKKEQEFQRALMIEGERARYSDTLYGKIEEALKFISEVVFREFENVEKELAGNAMDMQNAVKAWIQKTKLNEHEFNKAAGKAGWNAVLHAFTGIFSMGATALSLFGGPFGAVAGAVIGGGSSVADILLTQKIGNLPNPQPVPSSVYRYGRQMQEMTNNVLNNEDMIKRFALIAEQCARLAAHEIVNFIREALGQKYQAFEEDCELLDWGLKERMKLREKAIEGVDKLLELSARLGKASHSITGTLGKLSGAVASLPGIKESEYGLAAIEAVKIARDVLEVSSAGVDVVTKFLGDISQVLQLRQLADQMRSDRIALKQFLPAIDGIMGPFNQRIIDGLKEDATEKMTNSSRALLRVQKWQVQKTLKEYSAFLEDFTTGFPGITAKFRNSVKTLQDAVALMVDLYDDVQKYLEQGSFADYISNLASISTASFDKPKTKEGQMYWKLEKALLGSLIYSEWETVQQNFQQWIFPFSQEFQGVLSPRPLKDYLSDDVTDSAGVIKLLIPDIKRWVSDLRHQIGIYKSTTFPAIDNTLQETDFNSRKTGSAPFYVWKHEEHFELIRRVLQGEPVTVSIDPDPNSNKFAVKFRVAEIQIRARTKAKQKEVDNLLRKLRVELTHSGVSRYFYDGELFEMRGEKQFITYSFETNDAGQRLTTNAIYKKLKGGGIILSPYSVWTIRFQEVTDSDPVDFEKLATLASSVDMELVGSGTFVTKGAEAEGRKMKKKLTKGRNRGMANVSPAYPVQFYSYRKSGWPIFELDSANDSKILAKGRKGKKAQITSFVSKGKKTFKKGKKKPILRRGKASLKRGKSCKRRGGSSGKC